jgi:pyruvate dehydrogenase E2 component (dihydrolipoamide acetyltransferase)
VSSLQASGAGGARGSRLRRGQAAAALGLSRPPCRSSSSGARRAPAAIPPGAPSQSAWRLAALIPHVSHFDKADVTDLNAIVTRSFEAAKQRGITLTLTSFLLKAAALALREHPQFNASLDAGAGELILKRYCHLGIAVRRIGA